MKSLRTMLIVLVTVLCCGGVLLAQTSQGRISGRVQDPTGAVIVKAQVTIENKATGVKRVLDTNSSGDFVAPGIAAGVYTITVEAPNFRKVVRDGVQVEVAKDVRVDFELPPGATSEVLEVKEEAPLVDSTTSTLN